MPLIADPDTRSNDGPDDVGGDHEDADDDGHDAVVDPLRRDRRGRGCVLTWSIRCVMQIGPDFPGLLAGSAAC